MRFFLVALILPAACSAAVDFTREVRPILQKRCAGCHGAQQQLGGVRFDHRTAAMAGGYAGTIIIAGKSGESRLIQMVTTGRDGKIMPPFGPRLTKGEIATLRDWIDEGAVWPEGEKPVAETRRRSSHWAFQPIQRPALPSVERKEWIREPIDAFVLSRLEKEKIVPSPEADRRVLLRRVSLDLIGLPPSPQEMRDFLADSRADAYERAVDRLLASPHYGEKWARHWLDLARYADSDGYEQDGIRPHAWRYRDWVIRAFNANMPFDRFTIQQIAGDLLPNTTIEQKAGTGFHRNTLTSREGGIDVDQLRDEQVMDRANTVATTWLGLTLECARCHDHKYDPISQKDYYQFFAFFNSADEVNVADPVPSEVGAYRKRLPEYEKKLAELTRRYRVAGLQPRWEEELRRAKAHPEERLEWTQVLDYLRVYLDHGHEILMKPASQRTWKESHGITRVFLKNPGPLLSTDEMKGLNFGDGFKALEDLDAQYPGLSEIPTIQELPEVRKTFIHIRGDFRSPGIEVKADTPGVLPPLGDSKHDRLALGRWLIAPENPLTARVAVNRIWQELFGAGLVATSEDFGTRSDAPEYPEVLDWLASEFVSSRWNLKHVQKRIVMSSTYRQSSRRREDLESRDPQNRLLARQSRIRLSAESVRDAALSASGLLNSTIGGRSIRPPMPAGAMNVAYRAHWDETQGPERYRRGLYVFLQRSIPYPQLMTFDAPNSLIACSRRERSTTPLQALTLLNDPVFVEAAQALAARLLRESPRSAEARIDYAFEICFGRLPMPDERSSLLLYLQRQETKPWVSLASILLNLDEFITRE